jgi:hypothetical protein
VHLSALVRAEPNLRLASATNKHTNKQAQGTGKWLVQESIMTVLTARKGVESGVW